MLDCIFVAPGGNCQALPGSGFWTHCASAPPLCYNICSPLRCVKQKVRLVCGSVITPQFVQCCDMTKKWLFCLTSGPGDGFFSSAFQSRLIGNNLHNASMPECESQTLVWIKPHDVAAASLENNKIDKGVKDFVLMTFFWRHKWNSTVSRSVSLFFLSIILWVNIVSFWCRPGLWLRHYNKKPPYRRRVFALPLAPLPRGGGSKAATGQEHSQK